MRNARVTVLGRFRTLCRSLAAAALAVTLLAAPGLSPPAVAAAAAPMKIGIIGAGHMGGTLARLWTQAGHEVMLSSRHPDQIKPLARSLGPLAHVGTPQQAARFSNVVLIAVPFGHLPAVGRELHSELAGKIVIDLNNPYPKRDGPIAIQARKEGTGVFDPRLFPGARLVRAFNAITWIDLGHMAHRPDPIAIPVAGNDPHAVAVVEQLVRDAGYAPVMVGPLSEARRFDVGTPVYVKPMTVPKLRAALGLKGKGA